MLPREVLASLFYMKSYVVPPDINEKEKIVGGILTLDQLLWVFAGFVLGGLVFVITFNYFGKFSLVLGGTSCLTSVPFIVYKKNNLTLFEHLKRKHKFNKKTRHLPNDRRVRN